MSNVLDALLGRVHDVDSALANALESEIRKLQNRREYGLVYEAHAPEGVRLWGKKICIGDIVNVLPPRGLMETKENSLVWKVVSINRKEKMAHVVRKADDNSIEEKEVSVDDLVAYADFRQTIYPGLVEVDRVERGEKDDPYHVVINGENFHALQAMLWCYAGKVDCIYIDPPYNTGAKDWKYNNDYVDGTDQYRHSKWLSFMEQRLKLAKKLLTDNGILIVTIDDNEYKTLSMLIEQLYSGYEQDTVCVQMNPGGTQGNIISVTNEFMIFVYNKKAEIYRKPHMGGDTYNLRRWGSTSTRYEGATCFYPIFVDKNDNVIGYGDVLPDEVHPLSQVEINKDGSYIVWPIDINNVERKWRYAHDTVKGVMDRMFVVHKGDRIEIMLRREDEPMKTMWISDAYNSESHGTKLLKSIIGKDRFSYPKSLYAVRDALYHCTFGKKDALIVDFFAGSGTTLHAVNLLNAEDNGNRRCILITNNEVSDKEQKKFIKQGFRPYDNDWKKHGIAYYVTWARTKCSIEGRDINGDPLNGVYGCEIEMFCEYEKDVLDIETGKKVRATLYKKSKQFLYPNLSKIKLSDGFKTNAVFYDLKYEDGKAIRLNMAFKEIAPLLWMKAGSKGRMIQDISPQGYDVTEQYAILFDFLAAKDFIKDVKDSNIKVAYIVTDSEPLYQQIYKQLSKGVEPVRLYENYLTSFSIYGAV